MLVKRVFLKSDLRHRVKRLWSQAGKTLIASLNYPSPSKPPSPTAKRSNSKLNLRTRKGQFEIGQTWVPYKPLSQAKSLVPGKEISIYRISVKMMWPS